MLITLFHRTTICRSAAEIYFIEYLSLDDIRRLQFKMSCPGHRSSLEYFQQDRPRSDTL